jgi:hypothetical protein
MAAVRLPPPGDAATVSPAVSTYLRHLRALVRAPKQHTPRSCPRRCEFGCRCMHAFVYVCSYVFPGPCICVSVRVRVCVCVPMAVVHPACGSLVPLTSPVDVRPCLCVYTNACVCVYIYTRMHVCVCVCILPLLQPRALLEQAVAEGRALTTGPDGEPHMYAFYPLPCC